MFAKERAASPLFPPLHPQREQAREAVLHTIRRDPHVLGVERSRWTLDTIRNACSWLGVGTLSGIWRVLERLGIHWKRGREHVHSPDTYYLSKLSYIRDLIRQVSEHLDRFVLLFWDEFTFYRQPTLAQAWDEKGPAQPLAELGYRANSRSRVVGALDAFTGVVHFRQRSTLGVSQLVAFYQQIAEAYPKAERIWVVQDNWPVHYHPDVLCALQPQQIPFPVKVTPYWSTEPSSNAKRLNLPIHLVPLPTYASWCNPIEKVWRKLRQELLHHHTFADRWSELRQAVNDFLAGLANPTAALLRYVGLADPMKLYEPAFQKLARTY